MSDRQYRWLVVGYTLLMQGVSVGILIYCFALFAVPWLESFDASRRDVMLSISLLQIGMGLASPLAGRALDRIPMRRLIVAGALIMAAGLLLAARAQTLWQVQLVYATLFPVGMVLTGTLASQTLVARWFGDQRGLAIGISAMGTNLGGMLLPLVVAGWLAAFGWRGTLEWLALLAVALVVPLGWLVLRREPTPRAPGSADPNGVHGRLWSTREILRSRLLWIPMISMLPLNLAFGAVQFNLGAYAADLGLTPARAANLIALCSGCMILGKLFFGGLADRLDHRYLFWVAAACMSTAMLILQMQPPYALVVVGVVFVGLAGGGILPLIGVIHSARFGTASFGRVMGLVMLSLTVGALGPLLAGWVYDVSGSYDWAFRLLLGLFLPGVVIMRWLPAPQPYSS